MSTLPPAAVELPIAQGLPMLSSRMLAFHWVMVVLNAAMLEPNPSNAVPRPPRKPFQKASSSSKERGRFRSPSRFLCCPSR